MLAAMRTHLELLSLAETAHVALVWSRVIVLARNLLYVRVGQLVHALRRNVAILRIVL